MRTDELARRLASDPRSGAQPNVSPISAGEIFLAGDETFRTNGPEIRSRYGVLLHYTSTRAVESIRDTGSLGLVGHGVFLTTSLYAGCMVPANLGLRSATDRVLIIDPANLAELWGPGTSVPSDTEPLWAGGGIEFYSPAPIAMRDVIHWLELEGCGDGHQ